MKLGYPEADAKEWMNTVALKMLNKGAGYMSATDTNNAYKCFEFLSRDKYANAINGEITKQAKENVDTIKSMNVKKIICFNIRHLTLRKMAKLFA